jgi:hypothetical protein
MGLTQTFELVKDAHGIASTRTTQESIGPALIMKHNREHTVLLSAEEYLRLKRRDRQVFRVGELSADYISAIAAVAPPAEAATFDHEIRNERT